MSFERTTPCGVISGTACQWPGVAAYKGIRYATAGRWEFPVPVTHWDGVYDATQYGACCYQPRAFYDEAAAPGKWPCPPGKDRPGWSGRSGTGPWWGRRKNWCR